MILTALLIASAPAAEEFSVSRAALISLAPAPERYHVQMEIYLDGALIVSPALNLVSGETANLAVGGADGYRIDLTAEPSPAARFAPAAADDVFVSSRLFLAGSDEWQRVGDATVVIDPGTHAEAGFDLPDAPAARVSISYRLGALSN